MGFSFQILGTESSQTRLANLLNKLLFVSQIMLNNDQFWSFWHFVLKLTLRNEKSE